MSIKIVESLENVVKSNPDIISILILDKDGVPITGAGEEIRNRATLPPCFTTSVEQVKKLGLGSQKFGVYSYESQQLVILNADPLAIFIVAHPNANTGILCNLDVQLKPILNECANLFQNTIF